MKTYWHYTTQLIKSLCEHFTVFQNRKELTTKYHSTYVERKLLNMTCVITYIPISKERQQFSIANQSCVYHIIAKNNEQMVDNKMPSSNTEKWQMNPGMFWLCNSMHLPRKVQSDKKLAITGWLRIRDNKTLKMRYGNKIIE